MRWHQVPILALSVLPAVNAIFADDAFDIDYHHALIGSPLPHTTFFHKPHSSSNATLLYSISDKAVLGAVNPRDGSLLWRQVLGDSPSQQKAEAYLVGGHDGLMFSGYDNTVAAWDAQDGRLAWKHVLAGGHSVKGLREVFAAGTAQDVVVLAGPERDSSGATISRLGSDESIKWDFKDTSVSYDAHIAIASSPKHIFYISRSSGILASGKTKVTVIDIDTGTEVSQYTVSLDSEPLGEAGTAVVQSCAGTPVLVSSEKPYRSLKLNVLGNTKLTNIALSDDTTRDPQSLKVHLACNGVGESHILVHTISEKHEWAEVHKINVKTGDVKKAYDIPTVQEASAFSPAAFGDSLYFSHISTKDVLLYAAESNTPVGSWKRTSAFNGSTSVPSHTTFEVSDRGQARLALRAAMFTTDDDWELIRNGAAIWSRVEKLAYITKATWSSDIADQFLISETKAEASSNPLTAYLLRLTRHAQDLAYLPQYLMSIPESLLGAADSEQSVRQKLIGGKLVLACTSRRELLALDAAHAGVVRWRMDLSKDLPEDASFVHLSVEAERLTAYISDGTIAVVNISTGELVELKRASATFEKVVELPGIPATAVVKITTGGRPEMFSELAPVNPSEGSILLTINEKGEAVGWTVGSTIEQTWTIKARGGAKFVDAVGRPAHDPVASIGKVLGDRSVLYKYLTPNLALLTALSSSTITLYLINAVTGAILHTSSYQGVLPNFPIPTIISENWFAYSFTSQDPATSAISTQLVISELYESEVPNDKGLLGTHANYSSFAPDAAAVPFVETQSYTVAAPLSDLTVTQTIQGITSRHIVASVPDLNAVVGIPRDVLTARRPVGRDATALEAEEGLFRYSPILDLEPRFFLSHAREVIGIQNLMAAPTQLESTSMVFAFGHDVFGTQLAPSTAFDVLGKGFKRFQLILTIVALYSGVLFLRPMVRKKLVEQRFKF